MAQEIRGHLKVKDHKSKGHLGSKVTTGKCNVEVAGQSMQRSKVTKVLVLNVITEVKGHKKGAVSPLSRGQR